MFYFCYIVLVIEIRVPLLHKLIFLNEGYKINIITPVVTTKQDRIIYVSCYYSIFTILMYFRTSSKYTKIWWKALVYFTFFIYFLKI